MLKDTLIVGIWANSSKFNYIVEYDFHFQYHSLHIIGVLQTVSYHIYAEFEINFRWKILCKYYSVDWNYNYSIWYRFLNDWLYCTYYYAVKDQMNLNDTNLNCERECDRPSSPLFIKIFANGNIVPESIIVVKFNYYLTIISITTIMKFSS